MLNLFAASGHINYAKSARFYVQQLRSLEETDFTTNFQVTGCMRSSGVIVAWQDCGQIW
jgi:hypothetical protein